MYKKSEIKNQIEEKENRMRSFRIRNFASKVKRHFSMSEEETLLSSLLEFFI